MSHGVCGGWCDSICVDLWLCVCQPDTGGPPPKVLVYMCLGWAVSGAGGHSSALGCQLSEGLLVQVRVLSGGVVGPAGGSLGFQWLSWLPRSVVRSFLQSDGLNGT